MDYNEYKQRLQSLVDVGVKPEEQVAIITELLSFTDSQENRMRELEQSCNKLRKEYVDLALNNKRTHEIEEAKISQPQTKNLSELIKYYK